MFISFSGGARACLASKLLLLLLLADTGIAATYYVSNSGSDSKNGTSIASAWKTVSRVNLATLRPGDRVLFQGGQIFTGSLTFGQNHGGTATAPLTISSFGNEPATIASAGTVAISAYNVAGLRLSNLKVQGSGRTNNQHDGISFYADLPGNVKLGFIEISNVEVSGFGSYGISIGAWNNKTGFSDVRIVAVSAHDNGLGGINVWGPSVTSISGYAHRNVYIGYSKSFNNTGIPGYSRHTGDGITVADTQNGTIERSVAYSNGSLNDYPHEGPVGIWVYDVTGFLIQYNESFGNRTGGHTDGGGFDFDGGTQNSIMQYNYSHDNDGPGYLLCMFSGARPNKGNTIRYNISQNDGRRNGPGSIHLYSTISDASIYNNTISLSPTLNGTPAAVVIDGNSSNIAFRNNIFTSSVPGSLIRVSAGHSNTVFQANNYWAGGSPARIQWSGTEYSGLTAWRAAANQEKYGATPTGLEVNPQLAAADSDVVVANPGLLTTLTGYRLTPDSTLVNAGINLAAVQTSLPTLDFYGNRTPRDGAYDIGAHEVTATGTADLIAHWKLDDGGPTASDASGNDRPGTLQKGTVWTVGQIAGAANFDGVDDYISTSGVPPVEEGSFTVSAWVRPRMIPPGTGSANNAAYGIVIKNGYHLGLSYSSEQRFGMNAFLSDLTNIGVESSMLFEPGQFYHVAGVIDRNSQTTKIYVNGSLQGSRTWPSGLPLRNMGTAVWQIGSASPGSTTWAWPADAMIDDVRIYSRALADSEIVSLGSSSGW